MKKIRRANAKDMPRVFELIQELAHFEKEPDAVEITLQQLTEDGFGYNKKFICFVGVVDNRVEGFALVYQRYSTWKGDVIHLEDLIVSKVHRGSGLGTLLLDEVVKYGHSKGVKRICWEVLDWNESAIVFYEKKGANVMRDWDVVQLDENGIKNYLKSCR
jgi:GNAT superfamily N-acetyltransferase